MPVQRRNSEMVNLLAADFQLRYEPQFAWKSSVSQFLALTGLRGFWPTSSVSGGGSLMDLSGQNRILTYNGNPLYRVDNLAPNVALDGAGDYFSRADEVGLDITGTETYVHDDFKGLTQIGWYYFDNAAGVAEYMMSKWDEGGNQRSYRLFRQAAGAIRFSVSTDGTAVVDISTVGTPAAAEWFFAVGRYSTTAAEMDVWYNDEVVNLAAGVPASIHVGTADFNIGARHNGNNLMTGRLCYQFLCAAALPDAVINQLFHQSRAQFGV